MTRVRVAPEKLVMVSKAVQDRMADVVAQSPFTKETVDELNVLEPNGVTSMIGPKSKSRRREK
jgi:hypothetical protein